MAQSLNVDQAQSITNVMKTKHAFTNLSPAMEPAFPDISIVKISQ